MLTGKNAIITGSNRGIGKACVRVFAEMGANIWACARTKTEEFEADMQMLSTKFSVSIMPIYFDLNDNDHMMDAVKMIVRDKKRIDILVNNAGIADYTGFSRIRFSELKKVFLNNYIAPLNFTQLLARRMGRESSASIVFLSSIAGLEPGQGTLAYGGSKAAVSHAVKVLSRELAPQNIRVNAIAPGMVETDMRNIADSEMWAGLVSRTCLKRAALPEEIARVVAFLGSDMSSYITGQTIRVDGGYSNGL